MRSNWKGHLRLSLVSVPVQAITANVAQGGQVHFHQLHASCHRRIKYQKVCPVHGEVPNDEIVQGYEYAKGKYVIVDPEELDSLSGDGDRVIDIDTFLPPDTIDPLYFDGRSYYLIPDGAAGKQPYGVLCKAMSAQNRLAVARCVFSRRSHLVLVRSVDQLLLMTVLKYASQVRQPESIRDDVGHIAVSAAELKMAQTLIGASTSKHFDFAKYTDDYTDELSAIIQAKVEGKQLVAAPSAEPPPIINLMDALRKSLGKTKSRSPSQRTKAPVAKRAAGAGGRSVAHNARRKSS